MHNYHWCSGQELNKHRGHNTRPLFWRCSAADCCGEQAPEERCDLSRSVHHCLRRPERGNLFLPSIPDWWLPKEKTLHHNHHSGHPIHCLCTGVKIMWILMKDQIPCFQRVVLLFCCWVYSLSSVLSCFQGMTIKPLVELLDVKRKKRALPTVSEEIHSRVRHDSTYSEVLQYVL